MDEGKCGILILLDLNTAFDTVVYELLMVDVRDLGFVDDANTAGIGFSIAQKVVVLDQRVVTMPHCQCALRFKEHVTAEGVSAGFAGNDFELAAGAVEVVVLNDRVRVLARVVAGANSQCFSSVRT